MYLFYMEVAMGIGTLILATRRSQGAEAWDKHPIAMLRISPRLQFGGLGDLYA
jgi:hypothetical protein